MSLQSSFKRATTSINGFRGALERTGAGMGKVQQSVRTSATAVDRVRGSLAQASPALGRFRTGSDQAGSSVGRLRTAVARGEGALGRLRGGLNNAGGSMNRSKGSADKFKTSLDKLKSSADKTKNALRDVKRQADAVEKSVGKAGKNADRGGKSMGSLGRGLKGASLAQRGLNLAMAASPFGLIMTLLAPLIAQFVNMDKVAKLVRTGLTAAWSGIRSASSSAARFLAPLFKGVVNAFLLPTRMLVTGLNALIGGLNQVKFKVPDWVPVIGGKGFAFNLPKIPVPRLAQGGVVRARSGGTLALVGEAGESEAVIPLSRLDGMLGSGGGMRRLAAAVERLADRPVHVQVDSQTIARAVLIGQRQLARR
ncbi:hypothetical protein HW130_11820 [Streptomyces sp. PKU-EA00015]|uniref:hypothetical protein n=1 Tax=Streptomyces sp. PKU-EA00015 TaxID=2748326 RepID=UPI0015A418CC|nr:hypothetical protein [Streptomyces sp. PKU-EA00015]NWF26949.1 hypothetical protein [Streptomyces sp. PKU-EA00015]